MPFSWARRTTSRAGTIVPSAFETWVIATIGPHLYTCDFDRFTEPTEDMRRKTDEEVAAEAAACEEGIAALHAVVAKRQGTR